MMSSDTLNSNLPAITVYVYDAHPAVRSGFRRWVDEAPGLIAVGSSGDEAQAFADVVRLRPRVAVLGGCLPDGQALRLCGLVHAAAPEVACLVAPNTIEAPYGPHEAAAAGAAAFALKRLHGFRLVETITELAAGGHPIDRVVAALGSR